MILLKSMIENHIDKIVFSSTAATYGEPENIPILENDKTEPTNTYGETKLAMEKMFKWAAQAHNIRYVSLRYFNACGAHKSGNIGEAHNPETHLIPLILQVPNNQRPEIKIFGDDYETPDGTCVRDYIHVTDLANAHILAVNYLRNGNDSNIFNLGNGVGFSVKEVIDVARNVTGHPIPASTSPKRAGDPAKLIASSEKAKNILGWKPQFDNIEQINRLIRNGYIKSKDNRTYYMDVTLAEALTLGYSREALETAIQSIEDGTIYKCGFITQPSYVNLGTNALDTKSTNYQIITGGYLETDEANLSVTDYLMLPPDQSIMNAVGVRFENKGSNGTHTFTTVTDVGTMSRSGSPGGYIYVPVLMGGTYIGLTYVTTGSNGGRVDYHRAFRNDLQWN